jgi:hypothetical protein
MGSFWWLNGGLLGTTGLFMEYLWDNKGLIDMSIDKWWHIYFYLYIYIIYICEYIDIVVALGKHIAN